MGRLSGGPFTFLQKTFTNTLTTTPAVTITHLVVNVYDETKQTAQERPTMIPTVTIPDLKPVTLPYQVYKQVEGRSYASGDLVVAGQVYEFETPYEAERQLALLIAMMLDLGDQEGKQAWLDADASEPLPGGFPELRFYDSNGMVSHAYKIAPYGSKGTFTSPLGKRNWQVQPIEPALPCGWRARAEFVGSLPACLRYAQATYALELDCPSVSYQGLNRAVIAALVGAGR